MTRGLQHVRKYLISEDRSLNDYNDHYTSLQRYRVGDSLSFPVVKHFNSTSCKQECVTTCGFMPHVYVIFSGKCTRTVEKHMSSYIMLSQFFCYLYGRGGWVSWCLRLN